MVESATGHATALHVRRSYNNSSIAASVVSEYMAPGKGSVSVHL